MQQNKVIYPGKDQSPLDIDNLNRFWISWLFPLVY